MITLRPEYQQPFFDNIIKALYIDNYDKVCSVLPTGGGKSVIIAKLANQLQGRTLILTHRIEILKQNSEWLQNAGILSSKENTIRYDSKIVISMVQTLDARLKNYDVNYLGEFDNIIIDECHILIYEKVFSKYNYKKLIGFTGSPIVYGKNIYHEIDGVEYVEPYTLSEIFDTIVSGPDSQDLIDLGYLVQDYNIALKLPDFDKLKESKSNPDGYTSKSMNEVYYNTVSLNKLDEAYYKYALGKKTLIFNSSNKVNKFVYDHLKSKGLNAKMYDTSKAREFNEATGNYYTREEIIEWFRNERNAILIGTNVFTTGFDVDDVEVVVVNRATKSLALWIQIVGRGSRTTKKIFKDKFTVIDLGQNIYEHGIWSKRRDWKKFFYSSGKQLKKNRDMLSTWECEYCGYLNVVGEKICSHCEAEKLTIIEDGKIKKFKDGEFVVVGDMHPPRGNMIVKYCVENGKDINFAFKLTRQKILELFDAYKVRPQYYAKRKYDYVDINDFPKEGFDTRIKKIFRPCYFAIIDGKNGLTGNRKRTYTTELQKIIKAVELKMEYNEV